MPELKSYTPIGGTHDLGRGNWFECDSPFAAWMGTQGYQCRRRKGPFWSTALGGIPVYKMRIWEFGASVLAEWMDNHLPVDDRRVISVSHGGQVAMIACANGLRLHSLVCITMPQRKDMADIYRAALPNIGTFTNVYSDSWTRDFWQLAGTLADGAFRFRRQFKLDGVVATNIGIKGVGHTDLVRTEHMVLLKSAGVLARL
jgi:hypothetical protein